MTDLFLTLFFASIILYALWCMFAPSKGKPFDWEQECPEMRQPSHVRRVWPR